MDKYIIATLDFAIQQHPIFIVSTEAETTEKIGSYTIEELPNAITELAYKNNIYNVKLAGANKFSQLIEYGIGLAEMKKYNERKIEIEVI